jgi:hypothetical protein
MPKPMPLYIRAAIERAVAFRGEAVPALTEEEIAALREHGRLRPLVELPWLSALYARQDAEWALEMAVEREDYERSRGGMPQRLEVDGIDVDRGETRCPACRESLHVRVARSGLAIAFDRDGRPHGHGRPEATQEHGSGNDALPEEGEHGLRGTGL